MKSKHLIDIWLDSESSQFVESQKRPKVTIYNVELDCNFEVTPWCVTDEQVKEAILLQRKERETLRVVLKDFEISDAHSPHSSAAYLSLI